MSEIKTNNPEEDAEMAARATDYEQDKEILPPPAMNPMHYVQYMVTDEAMQKFSHNITRRIIDDLVGIKLTKEDADSLHAYIRLHSR